MSSWFERFMGVPSHEQSDARRWGEILMWVIGTALALVMLGTTGCTEYTRGKDRCQNLCEKRQAHNVGARFIWGDLDRSFGRCTCVAEDGSRKQFYIKLR